MITREEFKDRILLHKQTVKTGIQRFIDILADRAISHDNDKYEPEIFESFYNAWTKFSGVKFGDAKWKEALDGVGKSLETHYKNNPHHPQYYSNGINGTNLIDLIEMLVDWKSACMAYGDCDFGKSLKIQKDRFEIDDQLYGILVNTAKKLGYLEEENGTGKNNE